MDGFGAAQPAQGPLLEHAQQLGLRGQRHVGDFIQEEGPRVRRLDLPHGLLIRSR